MGKLAAADDLPTECPSAAPFVINGFSRCVPAAKSGAMTAHITNVAQRDADRLRRPVVKFWMFGRGLYAF